MFLRPRDRWVLGAAGILASAVFVFGTAWAGTTGQLSGVVRDAKTGEPISLASVAIPDLKRGAVTDAQGNYTILNVPAGRYSVRVSLLGYVSQLRQNVELIPDFTTRLDFSVESTVLTNVPEVVITGERPLIQKDATGSTKFISGDDIKYQPLRGYQDAVAQQSGVVNFKVNILNEPQNNSTLIVRGGRSDEVAYYVDGFSQQDPLTGVSTTTINNDAIQEIVVQTGGFNAEYGRINSGIVNVVTREGQERYFGSVEGAAGDWFHTDRLTKIYGASLGGPIAPSMKQVRFFLSGEGKQLEDRRPSFVTDQLGDPAQPGLFENGVLPNNTSETWSGVGRLSWKLTPVQTFRLGGTFNSDKWRRFVNAYRFDVPHSPRYADKNLSGFATWNHSLSTRAFYEVKANYFSTERKGGDGLHFDDLQAYSRPNGNPQYSNEALFYDGDNPATAGVDEGAVWEDFLHRKSAYWGLAANYASQLTPKFQLKVGGDFQRHTLRYYDHYFPTQLYKNEEFVDADSNGAYTQGETFTDRNGNNVWDNINDISNVDRYGFDALGNELNEGDTFTDSNGNGAYDVGEPFNDKNGNLIYDDPLDVPKHPKVAALYAQGKYEQLGLVVNAGLRWDYLTAATHALRSEGRPLDPDIDTIPDTELTGSDLGSSKAYNRISPRIGVGFPVSDRTLLHVNYGKFFQQPNLADLYVSYAFLEYKIKKGGYFVGFGNPNLKPEQTTAYELGLTHTPTDRSRIEAVAYYKDVKDLVEIQNIPAKASGVSAFASYRNVDYGTIKGLDLSYTLRRVGHVALNASYSLSWAYGTGSASQDHRNRAWVGTETPKMTRPLDFDQRHRLSANLDYRFGPGQGPSWGGSHLLENVGINVLVNAGSGTPYTPTKIYNEVTLAAVTAEPIGQDNSRYGPWTFRTDLKANKGFKLGEQTLDVYLWVLNVFNRDNVNTVYGSSGSATTTNWLSTTDGQDFLTQFGETGARHYRLAELNPGLHDIPRLVRFGAKLSF